MEIQEWLLNGLLAALVLVCGFVGNHVIIILKEIRNKLEIMGKTDVLHEEQLKHLDGKVNDHEGRIRHIEIRHQVRN